jgi:hypothetical protein
MIVGFWETIRRLRMIKLDEMALFAHGYATLKYSREHVEATPSLIGVNKFEDGTTFSYRY